MSTILLQYLIEVNNSKYRELLNVFERELTKAKPIGCKQKDVFQSLNNLHKFTYVEYWKDEDLN